MDLTKCEEKLYENSCVDVPILSEKQHYKCIAVFIGIYLKWFLRNISTGLDDIGVAAPFPSPSVFNISYKKKNTIKLLINVLGECGIVLGEFGNMK